MKNKVDVMPGYPLWRVYAGIARVLAVYGVMLGLIGSSLSMIGARQAACYPGLLIMFIFAVLYLWPLLPYYAALWLLGFLPWEKMFGRWIIDEILAPCAAPIAFLVALYCQIKLLRRAARAAANQQARARGWYYAILFSVLVPLLGMCLLFFDWLQQKFNLGTDKLFFLLVAGVLGVFACVLLLAAGMARWRGYDLSTCKVLCFVVVGSFAGVVAIVAVGVWLGWWPLSLGAVPVLTVLLLAGRLVWRTPLMAKIMQAGQPEADKMATLRYFL